MAAGGPQRKKRLILKEHEWDLVRTFVRTYFEREDKAVAAKATYNIFLSEIRKEYSDFDISVTAFKTHVGEIEKLKEKAGVQIQSDHLGRDYLDRLKAVFLQVLIGLPLNTEFESIKFHQLIQRAHQLAPELKIIEKNRNTLACHFRLKDLKGLVRGQRPAEAAVSPGDSNRAAEAAQAALAAAAIDGPRLGEIQGRQDVQAGRCRPLKRPRRNKGPFDMTDSASAAHDEGEHSPRAAVPSPPADQDAAIYRDIPAMETQLAPRDGLEIYGATNAGDALSKLFEYNSEIPSSNAHTEHGGQPDCSPARDGDDHGTCISCLIFWNI